MIEALKITAHNKILNSLDTFQLNYEINRDNVNKAPFGNEPYFIMNIM